MIGIVLAIVTIAAMFALAIRREPLWTWAILLAVFTLALKLGLFASTLHLPSFTTLALIGWLPAILLGAISWGPIRRAIVTQPAFGMVKRILPPVSKTEQEISTISLSMFGISCAIRDSLACSSRRSMAA
jgi:acyl-CoA dehydrogenase